MGSKIISLTHIFKSILNEGNGIESDLPPGFTPDDIMTVGEFLKKEKQSEVKEDEASSQLNVGNIRFAPQASLDKLLQKSAKGEKLTKADPILHSSTVKGVIKDEETGQVIDKEKLMAVLSVRPKNILKTESNTKMMATLAGTITLPKYRGLIVDEKAKELKIVNTCPHAHKCIIGCYAGRGMYAMFKNSSERSARILTFLFNDWVGWKNQVINEIREMESKFKKIYPNKNAVVRWHDSGDFFSPDYLEIAISIAEATPTVQHYAYTKEVAMVKGKNLPKNFLTRFSYGGIDDKLIDRDKDKFSDVIRFKSDKEKPEPNEILIDFKKYYTHDKTSDKEKEQWKPKSPAALMAFKKEMAEKYKLNVETIKTFDEVMGIPETNVPKWNVIVTPSDPDNAAFRNDVLGIYLLYH